MFRILHENVNAVYWIFVTLISLIILVFLTIGFIMKKQGISLKTLLIGEECFFTTLSSIITFLTLKYFVAFFIWILINSLIPLIYKKNNKIINFLNYCRQNGKSLSKKHSKTFSKLDIHVKSTNVISWMKDYIYFKKEAINKIDSEYEIEDLKFKYRICWPCFFFSLMLSTITVYLAYGNLFSTTNSFFLLLMENYIILSCILFILYFLLYFGFVKNPLHYMYESKKLFKSLFALFSIIMYTIVTLISIN